MARTRPHRRKHSSTATADQRFARNVIIAGSGVLLGALSALALVLSGATLDRPFAIASAAADQPAQVAIDRMMLPVVDAGGHLHGYATVDMVIETAPDRRAAVEARLPLVRHAINLVAWKTPVTRASDPTAIDIHAMRTMLARATRQAVGIEAVHSVRVLAVKQG